MLPEADCSLAIDVQSRAVFSVWCCVSCLSDDAENQEDTKGFEGTNGDWFVETRVGTRGSTYLFEKRVRSININNPSMPVTICKSNMFGLEVLFTGDIYRVPVLIRVRATACIIAGTMPSR
jgi:hypothetical protein